jgi:hypothetical protein|nr:MAG TPA: hypothetical protein [Caudoviricetes sp.]
MDISRFLTDADYVCENTMEDSLVYKTFNQANGVVDKIVKYLSSGVLLDKSYIEDQYAIIRRGAGISPLSQKVLEAFNNGDIEIIWNNTEKVGVAMPFIVRRKSDGKIVSTIFINAFATIKDDSILVIPAKQLYGLMEGAYIALKLQTDPVKVMKNAELMMTTASVYTEMMARILNKEYALTLDKVLYDKVCYCIKRFYLECVWEYPNTGLVSNYASSDLKYIQQFDLDALDATYSKMEIKTIANLLEFVKSLSPRMSDLNLRYYIERFIKTYHGSSILSIDYLPYVFFVITNVVMSTFLVSQTALNDIIKNTKNINRFYSELARVM